MIPLSEYYKWFWVLVIIAIGCGVDPDHPEFPVGTIRGYKPIYITQEESDIALVESRPLRDPGKIYIISKYLLVGEKYRGIHIFDNTNPTDPIPLGFVTMAGNIEFAVRNNVLYADHLGDLVAIDITDWNNPRELSRTQHPFWNQRIPPGSDKYFECVDNSKGIVVGWEFTTLNNPTCFR